MSSFLLTRSSPCIASYPIALGYPLPLAWCSSGPTATSCENPQWPGFFLLFLALQFFLLFHIAATRRPTMRPVQNPQITPTPTYSHTLPEQESRKRSNSSAKAVPPSIMPTTPEQREMQLRRPVGGGEEGVSCIGIPPDYRQLMSVHGWKSSFKVCRSPR